MRTTIHKAYATDGMELDGILFQPENLQTDENPDRSESSNKLGEFGDKTNETVEKSQPDLDNSDTVIIHIHGKEGHFIQNHFVGVMGEIYTQAGYGFFTFNNRGHDYLADMLQKSANGFEWVTKGTAHDKVEEASYDINGVIKYLRDIGYDKVILQGHSLGPHKICYYMNNNPEYEVESLIMLSCADIRYLLDAHVAGWEASRDTAKEMMDNNQGDNLMDIRLWSNAPVSASTFWHYTRRDSNTWVFNYSNPDLGFEKFENIKLPMLAVFASSEFSIGISPHTALNMLEERTSSTKFGSLVIENTVHNYAGKERSLAKRIVEWLDEV